MKRVAALLKRRKEDLEVIIQGNQEDRENCMRNAASYLATSNKLSTQIRNFQTEVEEICQVLAMISEEETGLEQQEEDQPLNRWEEVRQESS